MAVTATMPGRAVRSDDGYAHLLRDLTFDPVFIIGDHRSGTTVLYQLLASVHPSPVVALNHAVAVAMADGPAAGLALIDALAATGALAGYHLLPAARADLLRRLGRFTDAAAAYREALALAGNEADRRFLSRRLAAVSS